MSRRRRGADFSYLLESFDEATDRESDPGATEERNEVRRRSYVREDECAGGSETSGTSYKSTILAGRALQEDDNRESTDNSYLTARSAPTSSNDLSNNVTNDVTDDVTEDVTDDAGRSDAPSIMNRAIGGQFAPQSDLELSMSASQRSGNELNRNIETVEPDSRDANFNDKRQILRRLSHEFILSPQKFTERLVTIIDRSETTGHASCPETSGVDLSRMTKEFRKICKYIQDESMPDHIDSILDVSKKMPPLPPQSLTREYEKKTPLKTLVRIFEMNESPGVAAAAAAAGGSPGSPNSTKYFVNLEKYLDELPQSPRARRGGVGVVVSTPTNLSEEVEEVEEAVSSKDKTNIIRKVEEQMASLHLDETATERFETFDSHAGTGTQKPDYRMPYYYSPDADADVVLNEDELSMSLRAELEKKRERCFETARQMQEIEEDARRTNEDFPKLLERYGIDPEVECLKTIESVRAYEKCWSKIRASDPPNKPPKQFSSLDSGIDTLLSRNTLFLSGSSKHNRNPDSKRHLENVAPSASSSSSSPPSSSARIERKPVSRTRLFPRKTEARAKSPGIIRSTPKSSLTRTKPSGTTSSCPTRKSTARSKSSGIIRSTPKSLVPRSKSRETVVVAAAPSPRVAVHSSTLESHRPDEKTNNSVDEKSKSEERETILACSPRVVRSRLEPRKTPKSSTGRSDDKRPRIKEEEEEEETRKIDKWDRIPKMVNDELGGSTPETTKPRRPNRFFTTPGKPAPAKQTKTRSKIFFPNLGADLTKSSPSTPSLNPQRIIKSIHAPGIYRKDLDTVISPISMYIRGTDVNLIQNLRSPTNQLLLTPRKKNGDSEEKLKFQLAPRGSRPRDDIFPPTDSKSHSDENDENKLDFVLPKAVYKSSPNVLTIDKGLKSVGGPRTHKLLQPMQNRVVIHHERQIVSERLQRFNELDLSEDEENRDSSRLSIHVQRSAEKTDFIKRWK